MMKVFSKEQIYTGDRLTRERQELTHDALMERASLEVFRWMHQRMQGAPVMIHIFSGIGNNGGDGLALARHLQEHGYHLQVYLVNYSDNRSEAFLTNLDRLKARKLWPITLNKGTEMPEIGRDDIIIDAIFGIGLSRPPAPWVQDLFEYLNGNGAFILSLDVPSGLYLDRKADHRCILSNFVLSFQAPKLIFFLSETAPFIKEWEVLDIGWDREYMLQTETEYHTLDKSDILQLYRPRDKFSHKGHYGHACLIGGSKGKLGAIHLAALSALKSGAGLVTAYVPNCGLNVLQTGIPEIMVRTDKGDEFIEGIDLGFEPTAIGIGPGMGTESKSASALATFLKQAKAPLILDADAINILAKKKSLLKSLPEGSILTPHSGELERLLGKWNDDFEKLQLAKEFVGKYNCILVLKGAHTLIISSTMTFINLNGNPGMATAGSGDVLTGIITGLLAQGYESFHAALTGVYLHGRAGDIQVEKTGYQALISRDIIEGIGPAYIDLFAPPPADVATEEVQTTPEQEEN